MNTPTTPLPVRAERLWPDSEYLQREWLKAVALARSTSRGWLLDKPIRAGEQRRA